MFWGRGEERGGEGRRLVVYLKRGIDGLGYVYGVVRMGVGE